MVSYVMNGCNFTKKLLDELDKIMKQKLRKAKMHGLQTSDKERCMSIEHEEKGVKSVKDVYGDTKT